MSLLGVWMRECLATAGADQSGWSLPWILGALSMFILYIILILLKVRPTMFWYLERVQPPWGEQKSILDYIDTHLKPEYPFLTIEGHILPDDSQDADSDQMPPGAKDSIYVYYTHATEQQNDAKIINQVLPAIKRILRWVSEKRLRELYETIKNHQAIHYCDALYEKLYKSTPLMSERIYALARYLVSKAPDREAVKVGLMLMSLKSGKRDERLLLTLGMHEEFTRFCAWAISNTSTTPESALLRLADSVRGWGRIKTVLFLANSQDPIMKAWLLREGYKNAILFEYLAYACAVGGDLASALAKDDVDDSLFNGACDLLSAMLYSVGVPVAGINEYEDASVTIDSYLRHAEKRVLNVKHFISIAIIRKYLSDDKNWSERKGGWTPELMGNLFERANNICSRPDWPAKIRALLDSNAPADFNDAVIASRVLGLDVWEKCYARVASGENLWSSILETMDEMRFDRALELAKEKFRLSEIATGPTKAVGYGDKFDHHRLFDQVLMALPNFPKKGWIYIKAGMRSPVVSNRRNAIRAFEAWAKSEWPTNANLFLQECLANEPDEDVQKAFAALLAGQIMN